MDRFVVVYPINVFVNPIIVKFFEANGVKINQDDYALSELIQFIYRSRIRQNQHIYCYIPSVRMRSLLYNYMMPWQCMFCSYWADKAKALLFLLL